MTIPSATAASRAAATGLPRLFTPSPETSMTRAEPSKPLSGNMVRAKSSAAEIEAPRMRLSGRASSASAKARAAAGLSIGVQSITTTCCVGPAHSR